MLFAVAFLAGAGTLEDMDLRSNVEASIRGSAETANLHLKVGVVDGVVIPQGVVRNLNQADDVVELASKIKGVTAVDRSGMRLEYSGPSDEAIADGVARTIFEVPKYASSSIRVAAAAGVVTLTGTIKNAAWRTELHRICGGIDGVQGVSDLLETPETPPDRIQKALDAVFGPRVLPRFPGKVSATAEGGTVTLEGRVPRLYDRDVAGRHAWGINGVRRVDNRLELGSGTVIRVIDP